MRVLVTGSSGHVGGAIARRLAQEGHDIVGVSRRVVSGLPERIRQVPADIAQPDFVRTIDGSVGSCDAIVHAAAELDKSLYAAAVTMTNGVGTQHLLHLAEMWDVCSFVFISGVAVIGVPRVIPIAEDHPVAPLTAYHAAKLYGEHLVAIARAGSLAAATLRLTAPAGPGMPGTRILSIFVERARASRPLEIDGKGTRRQNYIDVRDAARAVAQCLDGRVSGLFNVGGAETVSNLELAQRCIAALGSPSQIVHTGIPDPDDGVSWEVSMAAARQAFGYSPSFSLEDSIRAVG